ncbi:hypothetical protein FE391_46775 [Nonomuraea sp. KC401]|uniref:hypothetical protein n=1 Tax=unclassified Nonomuraea TaxID=2593643 RepID=UPI0010FDB41E|nr:MULTISPECIES: hypothetical protein [unclassified Nonomuraea]NBF00536.1 hypothetical protein [Nonomuraea sp. K271]TLF45451.1 hypothetical protein FE391_46775 [Nonomuraea sp. KC401]
MGTPQAEGGDAHGDPRPGLGLSVEQRPTLVRTYEGNGSGEEYDYDPDNVEEAYSDHIHFHRNGDYPAEPPAPPSKEEFGDLLARNRVDPGTAKGESFIKVDAYEDPGTGKALPTSPVEQLRRDLERLQGETGGQSLKVRLQLAALSDRELGTWQAAADFKMTTDKAQSTLTSAVDRVYQVYSAVMQALDDTVRTAKNADRAAAGDLGRLT